MRSWKLAEVCGWVSLCTNLPLLKVKCLVSSSTFAFVLQILLPKSDQSFLAHSEAAGVGTQHLQE